jgi:hypothetical protein
MANCYYFALTHMKPIVLALIENARTGSPSSVCKSCLAMVQFAKDWLTTSMQQWFDAQFKSTQAMASSIDYLLSFVLNEAGRWVLCVFWFLFRFYKGIRSACMQLLCGASDSVS